MIGTHPHCPQGWEDYKGKPIFYSLGNFLFNSKEGYDYRAIDRPHWYEGLCVVMTIKSGQLSWEVVNTRNVDNVGIEIDHKDARDNHNETICRYLSDKGSYNKYLSKVCDDLGSKELSIVDRTFHPHSLKQCTNILLRCWWNKIQKKCFVNDYSLQRLLLHDQRRYLLMWTMKLNNKK